MLVVDLLHLFDAAHIFFRRQRLDAHKGLDDLLRDQSADDLCAEAQHVRVVMLTRQLRTEGILTHAGINAANLVRDHGAAVADAVDKDTPVALALRDRERRREDKIRQIIGLLVLSADVDDLVSLRLQIGFDLVFHGCTGMIVCHSDFHDNNPLKFGT